MEKSEWNSLFGCQVDGIIPVFRWLQICMHLRQRDFMPQSSCIGGVKNSN